jgi:hypothetical protein
MAQLKKLKISSASGSSGWTNVCIKSILLPGSQQPSPECEATLGVLCRFFNHVLQGEVHPDVSELWSTGKAVLLPKLNEDFQPVGWRPISIGDALYRLFGRTIIAKVATELPGNRIYQTRPLQLGINTPGGCEIGAKLAQAIYEMDTDVYEGDDSISIIKVDIENAFPTIPRLDIYQALNEFIPALCRPFRTLYGHSSKMYNGRGELVGHCHTGVRQGCPLAMLFFSLGFHPTLLKIHSKLEEIKAQCGSRPPAGAYGFADDINAYIGLKGAHQAAKAITEIISEARMNAKISKCTIVVQKGYKDLLERMADPRYDHGFNISDEGAIVLGNPIGTEAYRTQQIHKTLCHKAKPIGSLDVISPQSAYMLLVACFNQRPAYLAKVAEPHVYWDAMSRFDAEVDKGVALIARSQGGEIINVLRSLPQKFGGLGIQRYHSSSSESACKATRERVRDFLEEHKSWRPSLTPEILRWYDLPNRDAMFQRYTTLNIAGTMGWMDGLEFPPESFLENLGNHRFEWLAVYQHLRASGRKDHMAAWFLSASDVGTGGWLNWNGGSDHRMRLTPNEFIESFRLRLLIDPYTLHGDITCPQCDNTSLLASPLHALDCNRLRPSRNRRHNDVADALLQALRSLFPGDIVLREGSVPGGNRRYQADVLWHHGGETTILDVAIVEPAAPTYRNMGSVCLPEVASGDREDFKRRHFQEVGLADAVFVPFVIEATGRLGGAARRWIDHLRQGTPDSAQVHAQEHKHADYKDELKDDRGWSWDLSGKRAIWGR